MATFDIMLVVLSALVALSVVASRLSERLGIPALLVFLFIGMLAGSEGPGGVYFDDADLARAIGVTALVLILYAGGLDTAWSDIRPVLGRGVALSTVGVVATGLLVGAFAAAVTGLSLSEGLLLGAIVSSTDAAAVFGVLRSRNVQLRADVRSLLELESGSNDPMAVFLTAMLVGVVTGEQAATVPGLLAGFVWQMAVGALIGYAAGRLMIVALNRARLGYDGLYPVLSLSLVLVVYGASSLAGANGFLAVYVAGIVMGNSAYVHRRSLLRFHDGLAWLMQIAMFLTLGLLVFPSHIVPVIGAGLLTAAFLMVVARPVAVALVLRVAKMDWRASALIGWVGLRGAVPIILATFALVEDVPNAETIFNVVFFIVLTSALVQGTTVAPLARKLGIVGPRFRSRGDEAESAPASYLVDYRVLPGTTLDGRQLAKAGLPDAAQVVLLQRYGASLLPTGGTRLRRDDVLLVLVDDDAAAVLDARGDLERLPGLPDACRMEGSGASDGDHADTGAAGSLTSTP